MKHVVLVLELSEDEAELVEKAVSATPVRFSGLTLSELLGASRAGAPPSQDGLMISQAVSEGAAYGGRKPVQISSLLRGHS